MLIVHTRSLPYAQCGDVGCVCVLLNYMALCVFIYTHLYCVAESVLCVVLHINEVVIFINQRARIHANERNIFLLCFTSAENSAHICWFACARAPFVCVCVYVCVYVFNGHSENCWSLVIINQALNENIAHTHTSVKFQMEYGRFFYFSSTHMSLQFRIFAYWFSLCWL